MLWGLGGGNHTIEECMRACQIKKDCKFLSFSSEGHCHLSSKCDDKKHGKGQFESKNKQDLASDEFKKKQIKMLSNQPRRSVGLADMNSRFVTFDFLIRGFVYPHG